MANKSRTILTNAMWNPITGCSPISEGCEHCYGKRHAERFRGRFGYPKDDPFRVTFHEDRLDQPLRWTKPRQVLVCNIGDLFHDDVSDEMLDDVFDVMALASQHTFMVLTKRPHRMMKYVSTLADRIGYSDLYCDIEREVNEDTDPDFTGAVMNKWIQRIFNFEEGIRNVARLRQGRPLPNIQYQVCVDCSRKRSRVEV